MFWNYLDFQLTNNTEWTFQINLWLTDKLLEGEIRVSETLDFAYHVKERNHKFIQRDGVFYRSNELWRQRIAKFRSGEVLEEECIAKNFGRVMYVPEAFEVG